MPYRPTERTEARRTQTREKIVRAALALVAQGGYREAQVAAVAKRAGCRHGHGLPPLPVQGRPADRGLPRRLAARGRCGRPRPAARPRRSASHRGRRHLRPPRAAGPAAGLGAAGRAGRPRRRGRAAAVPPRLRRRLRRPPSPTASRAASCHRRTPAFTATALVGAIGEALVGPLSPTHAEHRRRRAGRAPHHLLPAFHHRSGAV